MKRLLLALVLCMLVGAVGATSLDFQHSTDLSSITCPSGTCTFTTNATGGNYWVTTSTGGIRNANPLQTTYAAVSSSVAGDNYIVTLYDANLNTIGSFAYGGGGDTATPNARWELIVNGGFARLYYNGAVPYSGAGFAIAQNPTYILFSGSGGASHRFDEFVYGDTENKYVVTQPSYTDYKLVKDFITPAASGLRYLNDTEISSTTMFYRISRGNATVPPVALENQTIQFMNIDTGTVYATAYTSTAYIKDSTWNVYNALFNTSAPYGRYVTTILGTGAYSDEIWYLGSGATISFDKSDYSGQDTATMTYSVLGGYWDTSTYSYTIDVVSGTTGATMQSTAIASSSGTDTYTFTSTDPLGVYYGIVKATKLSDASVIWMDYDYAELSSYVTIEGYVNDAETGLPISGANVNITQNSIINNLTTIVDGNYSATYYLSGAPITINATAPLHRQYTYTFTPLIAKTIDLNVSLVATTPSVSGLGIGGVARDIAYGRPLASVNVWLINTTNAETNTKITSMTGWYLCDEGTSCFLTTKRPYDIWGEKLRYDNSQNYTVVAA